MDIWFTSDTHWGHHNILKYSNRPFSNVNEMNDALMEQWNNLVKPGDMVYHLGDVSFMQYHDTKDYLRALNGNIELILGNHDKDIKRHSQDLVKQGKIINIQNYKELKIGGEMLVLFHYGQRVWNRSHHGSIHLYGHSHGSLPPHGKSVDVGVDCKEITSDYRPIHLDEILSYMSKRDIAVEDHHDGKRQ